MRYKKINENLDNIYNGMTESLNSINNDKLWNIAKTFNIFNNRNVSQDVSY